MLAARRPTGRGARLPWQMWQNKFGIAPARVCARVRESEPLELPHAPPQRFYNPPYRTYGRGLPDPRLHSGNSCSNSYCAMRAGPGFWTA
jgi:hypothetical protein